MKGIKKMKENILPVSDLSGGQTFILICMALVVAIAVDLIIIGICKLYDLINKRCKEWKMTKSKNCEK